MSELSETLLLSGWLGILCAISPCPLAGNIAAISFLTRQTGNTRRIMLCGVLYVIGRMVTYIAIGIFLTLGLAAAPGLSYNLQKYMTLLMGPLMILVSVVLLNLIEIKLPQWLPDGRYFQMMLQRFDAAGALFLGIIFALNFCPTSAALYFGTLLPMMVKSPAPFILASVFGAATGIPVMMLTFLLALGTEKIGRIYNCMTDIQRWVQKCTGILFLCWGLWMTMRYTIFCF
ncbi:MAG: aromatic aminobenezylarsenical efflux permease ArsG family transporter [Clostridia bacterium]|nr:aromatic aminobenezylarsenical efflux permease ArsG family transporter [Clostridia bacterium]